MSPRSSQWPDSPLVLFWEELRQDEAVRVSRESSLRLAPEFNANACEHCRRVCNEDLIAVARCINCERWVCYECHNPGLPFGSVSDFNYFLVDADLFKELSISGVWLWPVMCPGCKTEVPRLSAVNLDMLSENLREEMNRE